MTASFAHSQEASSKCFPGDPIALSMAQYEFMSLDAAKRKVEELPRGTTLAFDDLGIKNDDADRVFEALRSVATEHVTILRATSGSRVRSI